MTSNKAEGVDCLHSRSCRPDARSLLAKSPTPSSALAVWQLANTLLPYACLCFLIVLSIKLDYTYLWTLSLAVAAAAFLMRIFILFHDCVHGSLFPSRRANRIAGHLLGILVFTAFDDWRFSHLRHHSTHGNLDTRGFGDIWTLTLSEYQQASRLARLRYRLYRNPLVMIGLGPLWYFLVRNRLPTRQATAKVRRSVLLTNLAIIAVFLIAAQTIAWQTYLMAQLPVIWLAGMGGTWLFYVQHQFPGTYWAKKEEWDPLRAAMEGSSHYKLPAVLNWFSANIGYHHIHHLNPRIPNYRLQACYNALSETQASEPLTIGSSASCFRLKLWDEERQRMTGFP